MTPVQYLWLCGAMLLVLVLIFYRAASAGQRMLDEIARWEREDKERRK